MKAALAAVVATAVCACVAAGASARGKECEAVSYVCMGTLPSSHERVVLTSRHGSGERGVASITLGLHQTKVVFRLTGAPAGVRQTVRILRGGCAGSVLLRLGTIVDGKGVRRADPISHLSGFAVVVHASTDRGAAVVACGVVPRR